MIHFIQNKNGICGFDIGNYNRAYLNPLCGYSGHYYKEYNYEEYNYAVYGRFSYSQLIGSDIEAEITCDKCLRILKLKLFI